MSVEVELRALQDQAARFGSPAFLVSVRDGSRPHVVAVPVEWSGDVLVVAVGRRSAANVAALPAVTVLWPGPDHEGFSLLVDGTAEPAGPAGEDGAELRIRPLRAVLHRSRGAVEPGAVGSDCRTVLDPGGS